MKILHIIIGLDIGGAEIMLKRLIESKPSEFPNIVVVSLTSLGVIGESLRTRGVHVHALGMTSAWHSPIVLWQLVRLTHQYQPDIVQTWMYHADFLGGLAARLAGHCAIVWGIRSTTISQGLFSFTFWLIRICAICSYIVPHRIICCAKSAKEAHINLGYATHKMTVIPNGFDFSVFDRHLNSRAKSRMELGYNVDDIVIGVIGRFNPLKDFHNFVIAASSLASKRGNVRFLMVGRNIEWSNYTLREWIESKGFVKNFQLVGEQSDVPFFLSAMDIFCLSSVSEAFPNVVVEAMAMGLPCVVTRAGDAADILGIDDFVVPVKDSTSLSSALLRMCDLNLEVRRRVGERGASKVRAKYRIENIRQKYEEVYAEIAGK